ncbi:MAG: PfkB family carbohydrate kinase [Planctomycetota bacterium]|nr:PfkB family carbohydrate kinase [Planctomycetota bacterium]
MSLLVTGTIGIDTVETARDKAENVLGGSAAYFAFAARLLAPVRLVGAVGDDFPTAFRDALNDPSIDTSGLETRAGSKTFRWHGKYLEDMNQRESISTDLNVVAEAPPAIPESFRDSPFVFLANTHPAVQYGFIDQLDSPGFVVCDTMDLWINEFRDDLLKTLSRVHGVVLNDGEARMLTGKDDLFRAAQAVLDLGPTLAVIKKGEHGAMLVTRDDLLVLPAFPTSSVVDPTGAGDSFAGGMMGHLAATNRTDIAAVRSAIAWGTCAASLTIEAFSVDAIRAADREALARRLARFRSSLAFD